MELVDLLVYLAFAIIAIDCGISLIIKARIIAKKKKLFICNEDGEECEEL